MKAFTKKFYHVGVDDQKRSDISVDVRRIDAKQVEKWSASQKVLARAFINDCESHFNDFKKALLKLL